jgi:co-chaperonin GroES (HSP10)
MKFIPIGDGVLIAPVIPPLETVSPAGIVTKLNTPEPPTRGDVVAVGDSVEFVNTGHSVMFSHSSGKEVVVDDTKYILVKEKYLDGFFVK